MQFMILYPVTTESHSSHAAVHRVGTMFDKFAFIILEKLINLFFQVFGGRVWVDET